MPSPFPTVSIVIPARNEARNLARELPSLPSVHEVVLVDGNSVDDTVATTRRLLPDARVVTRTGGGRGDALVCGFAAATGDVIVVLDADGSADPAEIPALVRALVDGADVAKGSRFIGGGGSDDVAPVRSIGHELLTGLVNLLLGSRYTDLGSGAHAFWRHLVPGLGLRARPMEHAGDGTTGRGDGIEVETMLHCRFHLGGYRIVEVPRVERPRPSGSGGLPAVRDGLRLLRTVWSERTRGPLPSTARRDLAVLAAEAAHRLA